MSLARPHEKNQLLIENKLKSFLEKFKSMASQGNYEGFDESLFNANHFSITTFEFINYIEIISNQGMDHAKFLMKNKMLSQLAALNQEIHKCIVQYPKKEENKNADLQCYLTLSQLYSINLCPCLSDDLNESIFSLNQAQQSLSTLKDLSITLIRDQAFQQANEMRAQAYFHFAHNIFLQYIRGYDFLDEILIKALNMIKQAQNIYIKLSQLKKSTEIVKDIILFINHIYAEHQKGHVRESEFIAFIKNELIEIENYYELTLRNPRCDPVRILSDKLSRVYYEIKKLESKPADDQSCSSKLILNRILKAEVSKFKMDVAKLDNESKNIITDSESSLRDFAKAYFNLAQSALIILEETKNWPLKQFLMQEFLSLCRSVEFVCSEALDKGFNQEFKLYRLKAAVININHFPNSYGELLADINKCTEAKAAIGDLYKDSTKNKHLFHKEAKKLFQTGDLDLVCSIASAASYLVEESFKTSSKSLSADKLIHIFKLAEEFYEKYPHMKEVMTLRRLMQSLGGVKSELSAVRFS